ncbi:PH domain-containing protein [Panacibacter ginsenosidivorans]|nr:PH domain-containing protein [Panacibacter ginsenosidivorans]
MKTYTASHLSEGNKLFACKITIDDKGVTLKVPGFLSGKESTVLYNHISAVDIESPMIGYSTIYIETTGDGKITAHGFTKAEVTEMKEMILSRM